jgi:hypothetical protein
MFEEAGRIGRFEKSLQMEPTEQKDLHSFANYFEKLHEVWTLK